MSPNRESGVLPLTEIAAHWRSIVLTCAIAAALSTVVTLLLPKKYTAVTRLFIEAPAGTDPRAATAVSPIYLDSLRTYELFASSDSLFLQALERFRLRQSGQPADKLKKSILKVNVPRNTKILEISATLNDPKLAHELALYLAQETIRTTENTNGPPDADASADAERQYSQARKLMDDAQHKWDASSDQVAVETLRSGVAADEQLRDALQKELTKIEVRDPDGTGPEATRIVSYRGRLSTLAEQIGAKQKNLAAASARVESLESELRTARRTYLAAESRLHDVGAAAGYRGERLRIIDPGIVPEHPSSPDLLLNVTAALVAALVLSVGGVLLSASGSREESRKPKPISIAAK
jgi:uncharacterized protein involved in exopolysaccharide biosynthesis